MSNSIKVFISYTQQDKKFVDKLKQRLENDGIYVVNNIDVKQNNNILNIIASTLDIVDFILVVISSYSNDFNKTTKSNMHSSIRNLLSTLQLYEISTGKAVMIPVFIGETSKIPFDLKGFTYLDFNHSFESAYTKLKYLLNKTHGNREDKDKNKLNYVNSIKNVYSNGNLVLFCGAGISYESGIPTWNVLLKELLRKAIGELINNEMAHSFLEKTNVSSLILGKYLKMILDDKFTATVRDVLYQNYTDKNSTIDKIVNLSRAKRNRKSLKAIITFNFDDIIEEKMKIEKIDYKSIFAEGERFEENEIPIYHPHGFLPRNIVLSNKNEIVFSEDAYHSQFIDPFSWGNLVQLNYLNNNTCLFVGISLTDPNMRRLLDVSMRKNGKSEKNHYIIKKHYTDILKISEFTTTNDLAKKLNVQISEIIAKEMEVGILVSINQRLDKESIIHIAKEFGFDVEFTDTDNFSNIESDNLKHDINNTTLLKIIESIEEKDANALGLNVIWINDFSEIPEILNKIYSE